jgi:hypothetical protein
MISLVFVPKLVRRLVWTAIFHVQIKTHGFYVNMVMIKIERALVYALSHENKATFLLYVLTLTNELCDNEIESSQGRNMEKTVWNKKISFIHLIL